MKVEAKIQKWGNSLALRITGPVKTFSKFQEDMSLEIEVKEGEIVVHPSTKQQAKLFTEKELLNGLNPHTGHADELI